MSHSKQVTTLALDLEATLISNAMSQFVRPGLRAFLEFCHSSFPKLIIYTAVEERVFRRVARQLVLEGEVQTWFEHLPHLQWTEEYKDLRYIPGATVESSLIVDDMEECIHPDQYSRWVRIEAFEPPFSSDDRELARVTKVLQGFL
jgi:hypothetical protein